MIEFLELLMLSTIFGAVAGIITTAVAIGAVWLVLTIDRAARR